MADEPLFKKHLLNWFGGKNNDARHLNTAIETVTNIPKGLQKILGERHHDEGIVKHEILGFIEREHLRVDMVGLEAYARKIKAADSVVRAIVSMRTGQHDLERLDTKLQYQDNSEDRAEKLAAAQHETAMLHENEGQRQYRPSRLKEIAERHRLVEQAELARAAARAARAAGRAQGDVPKEELQEELSVWEEAIKRYKNEVDGEHKFKKFSDGVNEAELKEEEEEVSMDDPRREEKLARIHANHRERVRARDRLIREIWRRDQ